MSPMSFPFKPVTSTSRTRAQSEVIEELAGLLEDLTPGDAGLPEIDVLVENHGRLISTVAYYAAASLAKMMALQEGTWHVRSTRGLPYPADDTELQAHLQAILKPVGLSKDETDGLARATYGRHGYINDPGTSDGDLMTFLTIPETLREARLLMKDHLETPLGLANAPSEAQAPEAVQDSADLYSETVATYEAAEDCFTELETLLDPEKPGHHNAIHISRDLHRYAHEVSDSLREWWMTDESARVSTAATLGVGEADELDDKTRWIRNIGRLTVAENAKIVLSIIKAITDESPNGTSWVSLPDIMAFSKTEKFKAMLEQTAAEGTAESLLTWLDSRRRTAQTD